MRRKAILTIFIIGLICISSACNKATSYPDGVNQNEEQQAEETGQPDAGSEIEKIDETAEHITMQLSKSVTIDASVTPKDIYDKELGNYTYKLVDDGPKWANEKSLYEKGELFNTVMYAGRVLISDMSFLCDFTKADIEDDLLGKIIDEAGSLDVNVEQYKNVYKVVRLDDQLYDSLDEYYQADWNNTGIPDEVREARQKSTIVFLQHEVEPGIALLSDDFIYFQVEKEEEVKGIEEVVYEDFESPETVMIYMGDMIEAAINEKNEIEVVCRGCRFDIKEKIGTVKVKSLKEMLHIIKDDFSNVYTPGTTIYDISLAYVPYLSEEKDETGLRKLYLAPYWCVSYYAKQQKDGELFTWRNRIFYMGETGEKVYEE